MYVTVKPVMSNKIISRVLQHEKIRFAAVGGLNTVVDFTILFSLVTLLSISSLVANVVSTSTALVVSYLLNKKAVFGDTDAHNPRQMLLFVIVTLSGLWILQGLVIWSVTNVADMWLMLSAGATLLIAKVIATLFSLTWNYLWYSRVVFRKANTSLK